jgi:hypothetical protein
MPKTIQDVGHELPEDVVELAVDEAFRVEINEDCFIPLKHCNRGDLLKAAEHERAMADMHTRLAEQDEHWASLLEA